MIFADWDQDRTYLEQKFTSPDFYRNTPGTPLPELCEKLNTLFEQDSALPPSLAKANAFALMMDEMQIAVSNSDYFPGFAVCQSKPVRKSHVARWQQQEIASLFSDGEKTERSDCSCSRIHQVRTDFEHSVPDWDSILKLGFSGLLERIIHYEKLNAEQCRQDENIRFFYESVRRSYQAALRMLDRLITAAEALSSHPRGRMLTRALKNLRYGSASDFYEVLLQIWIYFQLSEYADLIQTRSLGNLDRILYPFYRRDLEAGRFSEADIRYLIRSFMYQLTAMHYTVGHPFYFGGSNPDGSTVINELSYLILDEYDQMGIFDPKLHIKISPDVPRSFALKALDMIRRGRNSIVFVGEPCICRTMLKNGYSLSEAQLADIKGCYEYCVQGAVETAPVTVNAVKLLGLALHNGVEVLSGKQLGPETGKIEELTTFPRLYRAFMRQLFYRLDRSVEYAMRMEKKLALINPALLLSGTFESSLRRGIDGYAFGARYNNSNIWLCGAATAADSLTMIKRYVFDRKEFTLSELVSMLDRNFENCEPIRQKLLHDQEKFGNNLDLPDRIAVHYTTACARRFNGKPNSRGGFFTVSLHASNRFTQWAYQVEATADGRKHGDEMSKNMSPSQGCAFKGATSLVASALKFDSAYFMANLPIDVMLHPSEITGDAGLNAMYTLLMTFIKNYGHAIQFNVMDADLLRQARKCPEQYRDLQVRVCGWNVLWNSLPQTEQDAYIRQAEAL